MELISKPEELCDYARKVIFFKTSETDDKYQGEACEHYAIVSEKMVHFSIDGFGYMLSRLVDPKASCKAWGATSLYLKKAKMHVRLVSKDEVNYIRRCLADKSEKIETTCTCLDEALSDTCYLD